MPGRNEQVDFYVLKTPGDTAAQRFACRLIDKVFRQGRRVYVRLGSLPEMQEFDQLLWTFSQRSFVPHAMDNAPDVNEVSVVLGQLPDPATADIMVNLADDVPAEAAEFQRVVEVIPGDDDGRRAGRARFRHYRDQGFTLKTHDIA